MVPETVRVLLLAVIVRLPVISLGPKMVLVEIFKSPEIVPPDCASAFHASIFDCEMGISCDG